MKAVRLLVASSLLAVLPSALAEDAETETYTLTSSGSSKREAFEDAQYWENSSGQKGTAGAPLDSNGEYFVTEGRSFLTKNVASGTVIFGGKTLTIGTESKPSTLGVYSYKTAILKFPSLILVNGILRPQTGWNHPSILDGDYTVQSPASKPFSICGYYTNQVMEIRAKLHGSDTTGLKIDASGAGYTPATNQYPFVVKLTNAQSDFAGSISVVASKIGTPGAEPVTRLDLASLSLKALTVGSLSGVSAYANDTLLKVSELTLEDKAVIGVKGSWSSLPGTNSIIAVSTAVNLPETGCVYVRFPATPAFGDAEVHKFVVMTAPLNSLDIDKFALASGVSGISLQLKVDHDALTGDVLYVETAPTVLQTVTDQRDWNAQDASKVNSPNSLTNAQHWSDLAVPHPGTEYVVNMIGNVGTWLRTSYQGPKDVEFLGDALVFGKSCCLSLFNTGTFTAKSLRFLDGSTLGQGQWIGGTRITGGTVEFVSGTVSLSTFDTHAFYIDSELKGSACLSFRGPGSSSPQANFYFTTNSPTFKGTISVSSSAAPEDVGGKERNQKVHVSYADSLGGPLDAFNPRAMYFEKLGELIPEQSMVFGDLTRGFYYSGSARLTVAAGNEVDFLAQRTFDGELFVRGGGVVGLGGTVKFGAAFADAPTEGKNRLTFHAGDLKALSAGCVDGLVVTFADAASKVIIPADTTDAELLADGIRNVKTATPFVFPGEKLKVEIGLAGATPVADRSRTVGLFTVSEDAAASLRGKIEVAVPKSTFGHKATVKIVETADADAKTVTFAAECTVGGIMLIVR